MGGGSVDKDTLKKREEAENEPKYLAGYSLKFACDQFSLGYHPTHRNHGEPQGKALSLTPSSSPAHRQQILVVKQPHT